MFEREMERESVCVCVRERVGDGESECLWERESMCVCDREGRERVLGENSERAR